MKRIVIAPDSFKGSISSVDAAYAIADGVRRAFPDADIISIPVADGGEGTLERLVRRENMIEAPSTLPDRTPCRASYGFIGDTAVIEMARSAGLTLLPESKRDPLITTTYGVGMLISDALSRGFRKFVITVGGSATNDGGTGMLEALGAALLDSAASKLNGCGASLRLISSIDITGIDKRLYDSSFVLACDVDNPLLGANGATYVYGRQKGADDDALALLEYGMARYAGVMASLCGHDASTVGGAGAGGGIGFPLISLFGATVQSGISAVLEASGYSEALHDCDLVITGEGKADAQTLNGKAVFGVATPAAKAGIPVIILAGKTDDGAQSLYNSGISAILTLVSGTVTPEYAMAHAGELLTALAEKAVREFFDDH